ncbi:MAG: FkbM family methyltransferase [Porphyrobacter sp.]|nr:FkbM family methyltransferase [Porphyrobacter sp.]
MSFWRYGILKTARKTVWLSIARARSAWSQLTGHRPGHGQTAYGVRLWQRWDDRTFVYCHAGVYGRFLSDYLANRSEAFAFADVGANQGLYSLIAAKNPHCREVIAFEPVAATYAALTANIAINQGAEKVTALKLGISDKAEQIGISVPRGHSGMATLRPAAGTDSVTETIEVVSATELDRLLDGTLPLVIKVDVEGHEATVIEQLLACSHAPRIECIFYEIDRRWSDKDLIASLLTGAGFTAFRQVGRGHHFDVMATRS